MVRVYHLSEGCMDTELCNYDSSANTDDDSCVIVEGRGAL